MILWGGRLGLGLGFWVRFASPCEVRTDTVHGPDRRAINFCFGLGNKWPTRAQRRTPRRGDDAQLHEHVILLPRDALTAKRDDFTFQLFFGDDS